MRPEPEYPRLWRRLASCLYETLPMLAIVFATGLIFIGIVHAAGVTDVRLPQPFRGVLFVLCYTTLGAYCVAFWSHGQTLPMRAWKLRLVTAGSLASPSRGRCAARYLVASAAWSLALFGLLWLRDHRDAVGAWLALLPLAGSLAVAGFDPRRQALYDLLAGTRLVVSREIKASGR